MTDLLTHPLTRLPIPASPPSGEEDPMVTAIIVACLWFGCPEQPTLSPEALRIPPVISTFSEARVIEEEKESPVPITLTDSTNRGMGNRTSDVEEWRPLVAGHFNPEDVDTALCLMSFESGGNPNAKNPRSEARGLMQVMASVWAGEYGFSYDDLYTPEINLYVARKVKDVQGWGAWAPWNRGECR